MDLIHFQGVEFLRPFAAELPAFTGWGFVLLSNLVFVALLQGAAAAISFGLIKDAHVSHRQKTLRPTLFFLAQLFATIAFFIINLISVKTLEFSASSPSLFLLVVGYFGASTLALFDRVSNKVLAVLATAYIVMLTVALLNTPYESLIFSLGISLSVLGWMFANCVKGAANYSQLQTAYLVTTLAVGAITILLTLGFLQPNPWWFAFCLLLTSLIQWAITMTNLWANYKGNAVQRDQAQRYAAESEKQKLETVFISLHDDITGCPNDSYLVNFLNGRVANDELREFSLYCVRVRGLRPVQNALGLETANSLLRACAQRLAVICHALDEFLMVSHHENQLGNVVRAQGQEFFLVSRSVDHKLMEYACEKINETFSIPFEYGGLCLDLQANIGVAMFPMHGTRPRQVMQNANVAVDIAKRGAFGKVLFDPMLDPGVQRRLILLGDLRGALNRGDIYLTYQPQICLKTNQVVGVEALIRWQHPFLGLVPPDEFIPLTEQTGMIKHVSRWVCDRAAMDFVQLNLAGIQLKMSINISPNNLLEENFPSVVVAILEEYGIAMNQFCVELTETAAMLDADRILLSIDEMTRHGIIFAIDDFGTGFSSLINLKNLKIKHIKIDKEFIANIEFNAEDEAIIKAILEMANCLGVETVAEGVETLAAFNKLKSLGCKTVQGFYISESLPIDELIDWLQSRPNQIIKLNNFAF